MKAAILLYDSDCGFCRWSVDKILAWDRPRRLRPVALQAPEADALLGPMDTETKMGSWHLIGSDGRVYSGGAGLAPLLRLLPGGKPIGAVLCVFPGITDRAYRLVARNRDRFGRLIGRSACSVDPSRHNEN
jgi:predicted DCC family thiol-disulfide oxidoreductase YuxK